jgi:hypothetical protein
MGNPFSAPCFGAGPFLMDCLDPPRRDNLFLRSRAASTGGPPLAHLGAIRGTALAAHREEARTGGWAGSIAVLVWRELGLNLPALAWPRGRLPGGGTRIGEHLKVVLSTIDRQER